MYFQIQVSTPERVLVYSLIFDLCSLFHSCSQFVLCIELAILFFVNSCSLSVSDSHCPIFQLRNFVFSPLDSSPNYDDIQVTDPKYMYSINLVGQGQLQIVIPADYLTLVSTPRF